MDYDEVVVKQVMLANLISEAQLVQARQHADQENMPITDALVVGKYIDEPTLALMKRAADRELRETGSKATKHSLPVQRIEGYRIIRRIGQGGMGQVYLAEQINMRRKVALKVLHPQWAGDEEFRARFLLEARAAGKLNHPNLIQVYDVGRDGNMFYFSMAFIDGVTAEDLIEHESNISLSKVIDIGLQVLEVLSYLSRNDIVHRDIKPANIMLTHDGEVKLGDFGFIQNHLDGDLLQEGTTLGTPDYISPEQARGDRNLDVRSDLYSLGASLFHMLGGRPLYVGKPSSVMRDHIETPAPDLKQLRDDLPPGVYRVLERLLAKDPADRYQTPDEVAEDLHLLRIDTATSSGEIPGTRSQIINVITAEKGRIHALETQLEAIQKRQVLFLVLLAVGWSAAVIFAALYVIAG